MTYLKDYFFKKTSFILLAVIILALAPFTEIGKIAFYLLFILSIIYSVLNYKSFEIQNDSVKWVLFALVAWFAWTVLTNVINGVPELTSRSLWRRQANIISIIPMFFLFKAYPVSGKALIKLVLFSSCIVFARGVYEIYYLDISRLAGGEHPIQYASIAMLMLICLLTALFSNRSSIFIKTILFVGSMFLIAGIIMTLSRGVWLMLPVIAIMLLFLQCQKQV